MTGYTDPVNADTRWMEPIETIRQGLSGCAGLAGKRRTYLGLTERLFIGAVMNIPAGHRQWGMVSWLGEVYRTSRPTLYRIGQQVKESLLAAQPDKPVAVVCADPVEEPKDQVSEKRLKRTILTLTLPGKVSGRNMADCLSAAFDRDRSNGYVSA